MTMDHTGRLCCSTKVVNYLPDVCIIENCLDYLYIMYYGGTHRVSAVEVIAVVVVVVVVVYVVIVVLVVVVAVVVPAIWRQPAVACNVSTTAARWGRADPIGSQANPPGRRGLVGY